MSTRFGEKAADRGRGLGPWTVHVSFRAEEDGTRDLEVELVVEFEG